MRHALLLVTGTVACLFALNSQPTSLSASIRADRGLEAEKIVLLFRHGIRAPLPGEIGALHLTAQAWPDWSTPPSHLTPHGREGMRLLGQYDGGWLRSLKLLPSRGCPSSRQLLIHTNTEQRTIASGQALAAGLAPHCQLDVVHRPEDTDDPLFHPIEAGAVSFDANDAVRAVVAQTGGLPKLAQAEYKHFETMQHILGCHNGACRLTDADENRLIADPDHHSMTMQGPIQISAGTAQVLLLEYAEDMPLKQVGWGRADPAALASVSRLHALLFDVYDRPDYMAARIGGPLAAYTLKQFNDPNAPLVTFLVASDNNISALTSLLGVDFQTQGFGLDDPPPGSALIMLLLRDPNSGQRYVRLYFQAQTLSQLRNLDVLTQSEPPEIKPMPIPECHATSHYLCPLEDFKKLLSKKTHGFLIDTN